MLRIIAVDDTKEDLLLANHLLSQCKLRNPVSRFRSGDELIAHIQAVQQVGPCERPEPSLILLDLVMANSSGLEVLRFLQNSPYREHCAVVMMSGLKDIKAINEGYQLGAKTFLLKPITSHDIVEVLNGLSDYIFIREAEGGYLLDWKGHVRSAEAQLQKSSRWTVVPEIPSETVLSA
jgi:response regulator RpfG family c-di-GMP phosphodiesterase